MRLLDRLCEKAADADACLLHAAAGSTIGAFARRASHVELECAVMGSPQEAATGAWVTFVAVAALLTGACESPTAAPAPLPSAAPTRPAHARQASSAPAPPTASTAPPPGAPAASAPDATVAALAQGRFVGMPADGEAVEVTLRGDSFWLEASRLSRPPLEQLEGHVTWRAAEGCFDPAPERYEACFRVRSATRIELTTRNRGEAPPLRCAESGVAFWLAPPPLRGASLTVLKEAAREGAAPR